MKQKWGFLISFVLCALLLFPSMVIAGDVTPEDFLNMTDDAQEQYLKNTGMSYEEAAGWSTDGGGSMMDYGYVQCENCGGWYMNGNEFRNHLCTGDPYNPSSSWTSNDDYYDALVNGSLNTSDMSAIGTLYVNTANGKGLNMRSRPNTNGGILTTIPDGAAVTLYWYENNSWAFVTYRNRSGFCMIRYLSDVPGSSVKPSANEATVAPGNDANLNNLYKGFRYANYYVAVRPSNPSGFVNMRWAPSTSSPVQCIYYADTRLKVIATNDTWTQVYNEQTRQCGFIMSAYLSKYLY